jgi:hypothetical protein
MNREYTTMKLTWRCLIATLPAVLLCLSCASQRAEVRTNHDPQADFSAFKTYAWIEPHEDYQGWRPPQHLDIRLRRVVDDIMAEKGYQRAPVLPMADLLLVYYASVHTELRITGTPYGLYPGWGYSYWNGAPYGPTDVRRYAEGTVMLDIIDRKAKQLVWTGQVTSAIQSENPPSERMAVVAEQLLAGFPPG